MMYSMVTDAAIPLTDPGVVARISDIYPNAKQITMDNNYVIWTRTDNTGFYDKTNQLFPETTNVDFLEFTSVGDSYYTCGVSSPLVYYRPSSTLPDVISSMSSCYGLAVGSEYVYTIPDSSMLSVQIRNKETGGLASGKTPIILPSGAPKITDIAAVSNYVFLIAENTLYRYNTETNVLDQYWSFDYKPAFIATVGDSVCVGSPEISDTAACYAVQTRAEMVYSFGTRVIFQLSTVVVTLCIIAFVL